MITLTAITVMIQVRMVNLEIVAQKQSKAQHITQYFQQEDSALHKLYDGIEDDDMEITYNRNVHVQFPTAVVGDQGTCKVTLCTKNRSQAAFKWVAEIPGNLHTKGYLCQAAYEVQKAGVFLYLVNKVIGRAKVY